MELTIVHNSDTNAHVHKRGCADIRRRETRDRAYLSHWDTEHATRRAAARDAWSDFIGESMDEDDALTFTEIYPCCAELPEGYPLRTFELALSTGERVTWSGEAADGHDAARQYAAAVRLLCEVVGFTEIDPAAENTA